MSEGPNGYQDSRPGGQRPDHSDSDGPEGDPLAWYQRGLELLSPGRPARRAPAAGGGRAGGARSARGARAPAPAPVRRPPVHRGGRQLPADRRGQPGRRLRPLRAGPVTGPLRGSGLGRRVPGAGRGHAAGPEALHRRPAPGARYAALPDGPAGPGPAPGGRLSEQPAPATQQAPRASEEPLCRGYDVALLDLDGVVYIGGKAVPGAREALTEAQQQGMRLAYVTNNASRTPAAVAQILTGMGMPAQPADVVTSAQAAARLLAERLPAGAPVLVIGGMGLRVALRERDRRPGSPPGAPAAAVVEVFAPQIDSSALAQGGLAVRAGALFVGTNADLTIPNAQGIAPGNGSLLQVGTTAPKHKTNV